MFTVCRPADTLQIAIEREEPTYRPGDRMWSRSSIRGVSLQQPHNDPGEHDVHPDAEFHSSRCSLRQLGL
jgi:hypothetical protein